MTSRLNLLLVEDDENEVQITRRALAKTDVEVSCEVVNDGLAALDRLYGRPPFEGMAAPDLVLLDINLPKLSGMKVLRAIKEDPVLRVTPVLMLTNSDRPDEIAAAYTAGANAFITKPLHFAEFVEVLQALTNYWGRVARLPHR